MKPALTLAAAAMLLLETGCRMGEPLGWGFGNSVRHNMSHHIIDPTPRHSVAPAPELSGLRAAGAIERYEKGEVIVPIGAETTNK